jgi:hypothetical protein
MSSVTDVSITAGVYGPAVALTVIPDPPPVEEHTASVHGTTVTVVLLVARVKNIVLPPATVDCTESREVDNPAYWVLLEVNTVSRPGNTPEFGPSRFKNATPEASNIHWPANGACHPVVVNPPMVNSGAAAEPAPVMATLPVPRKLNAGFVVALPRTTLSVPSVVFTVT